MDRRTKNDRDRTNPIFASMPGKGHDDWRKRLRKSFSPRQFFQEEGATEPDPATTYHEDRIMWIYLQRGATGTQEELIAHYSFQGEGSMRKVITTTLAALFLALTCVSFAEARCGGRSKCRGGRSHCSKCHHRGHGHCGSHGCGHGGCCR
jgi:hypothetical protein